MVIDWCGRAATDAVDSVFDWPLRPMTVRVCAPAGRLDNSRATPDVAHRMPGFIDLAPPSGRPPARTPLNPRHVAGGPRRAVRREVLRQSLAADVHRRDQAAGHVGGLYVR